MFSVLAELPHIICLREHHLKYYEIDITPITKYKLGAKYCRKILKNVSIYIQESLKFTNINLQSYCKKQDIEICAVKHDKLLLMTSICVYVHVYMCLY